MDDKYSSEFFWAPITNEYVAKSLVAICPFNRSHMVKKNRLQYHIIKCLKSYKGTKVPCPYNQSEFFEPEEMIQHLAQCPSKNRVEVQEYNSNKNKIKTCEDNGQVAKSHTYQNHNRYSEENWGLD